MSRVRSANTNPELLVRQAAHALGLRFRLHRSDLPGTPDLVFPRWRVAILVHGCFWHRHAGCAKASLPKTRAAFWRDKFERNVRRDQAVVRSLRELGWQVEVIWECEAKRHAEVERRLRDIFLPRGRKPVHGAH